MPAGVFEANMKSKAIAEVPCATRPHNRKAIESRIARLELENRTLKRIALATLLFLGCIGLMGQAKQRRIAPPPPTPAVPAGPKTVEAQSFLLKDANGKIRAELSMAGTGPSLKFHDESGSALATLSVNDGTPGGPFLLLSDRQHHGAIALSALEGGGTQLSLTGERPEIQLRLGVTPDGTALELWDKDGFSTSIGNGTQPSKNGQIKKTSAASIALLGKDRKLLWSAP